jgi:hypothetical protein
MIAGTKVLALIGLDLILNPALVGESKREFENYKTKNYKHPYPTENDPNYIVQ